MFWLPILDFDASHGVLSIWTSSGKIWNLLVWLNRVSGSSSVFLSHFLLVLIACFSDE